MPIYLIGYSYSGKSTLGRQLAALMGYKVFDTDKAIEHKFHTTIPLFFERYGEKAFRIVESQILSSTSAMEKTIVATGGGTACSEENIRLILNSGIAIYLQMSVDDIMQRIAISHKKRPLLASLESEEQRHFIERQLSARIHFYSQAQITVPAFDATAEKLKRALEEYGISETL